MTTHQQLRIPILCSDGTPAMHHPNTTMRDEAIGKALYQLQVFFERQPQSQHHPYTLEPEDLPLLLRRPREKHLIQTEPTYKYNTNPNTGGRLNRTWENIKVRTQDEHAPSYQQYGAQPHTGDMLDFNFCGKYPFRYNCIAFLHFVIFIETILGRKPSALFSLDRVNGCRGYVMGNLRWANKSTQSLNRGDYTYTYAELPLPRLPHHSNTIRNPKTKEFHSTKRSTTKKEKHLIHSALNPKHRTNTTHIRKAKFAKMYVRRLLGRKLYTQAKQTLSPHSSDKHTTHLIRPSAFQPQTGYPT